MKKTIIVLFFLFLLTIPVTAAQPKIFDGADLLTTHQIADLEEHAQQLSEDYGVDVVIVTVNSTDGSDAQAYADDFYDDNGYAIDGILLLLVMDNREWVISTCGSVMDTVSSRDCDALFTEAAPYISDGDYYEGFQVYLVNLPYYLYPPHPNGVPKQMPELGKIGISLLVGAVIGGIVILIMISSMRTARPNRAAAEYVSRNSFRMHIQRDFYLYSHTTRTKIETNSSGSHRSSSGRSHGGSRGRF